MKHIPAFMKDAPELQHALERLGYREVAFSPNTDLHGGPIRAVRAHDGVELFELANPVFDDPSVLPFLSEETLREQARLTTIAGWIEIVQERSPIRRKASKLLKVS